MALYRTGRTTILVFSVCIVAIAVSGPAAAHPDSVGAGGVAALQSSDVTYDHDPENISELRNTSAHGYNVSVLRPAFSLDSESGDLVINTTSDYRTYINNSESGEVLYNLSTNRTTALGIMGLANDVSYDTPPSGYEEWNDAELTNISRTDGSSSTYPEGAELYDGTWIRDAHVTRFRQSPSTLVQYNESHTVMYSGQEGNVTALVDYRMTSPSDDTDGSDGERIYRSTQSHSIEDVCLLENVDPGEATAVGGDNPCDESYGYVVGVADNVTHPQIEYDNTNSIGETNTYYLVAVIEAEVEVTTEVQESYQDCEVVNGTEQCTSSTRWVTEDVSTETDQVLAQDTWDTRVYDPSDIIIGRTPDGGNRYQEDQTELYVYTDGQPMAGLNISGTQITTPWRFYTQRGTEWDTLTTASNNGSTSEEYLGAVPIRTYAYPSRNSLALTNSTGGNVSIAETTFGEEREAPELDDSVTFEAATVGDGSDNYSHIEAFRVQVGSYDLNDIRLVGMVAGADLDSTESDFIINTTREETNLTVTPVDSNTTHIGLHINLTTEDGDPIYLGGDVNDGVIRLENGRTVETNESGEAYVIIEGDQFGSATYEPEDWYGKEVAYKSSYDTYAGDYEMSATVLYRFLWEGAVLFFICFFPFYLLDQFPGFNTWPPWKA